MYNITTWIVLCLIISANYGYEDDFVIIKYPTEIIVKYFYHLRNFTGNQLGKEFPKRKLFEICHKLRRSGIFRIENFTDQQHSTIVNYTVRRKILKTEKQQLHTQFTDLLISDSAPHVKLPTLRCLDLAGDMRWHITPAFLPDYAFLFTVDPNFRYISSREINSEKKQLPQLTAIIDKPARCVVNGQFSSGTDDELKYHIDTYSLSETLVRDPLCDLNPMIKFRLCALAADTVYLAYDEESYSYSYDDGDDDDDDNNDDDNDDDDDNDNGNNNENDNNGGDNDDENEYSYDYTNEIDQERNTSYKEKLKNYYKKSYIYKDLKHSLYPVHGCQIPSVHLFSSNKPLKMKRKLLYCYTTMSNDNDEVNKIGFYLSSYKFLDITGIMHMYRYDNWEERTVVSSLDVPLFKRISFYTNALKTFN